MKPTAEQLDTLQRIQLGLPMTVAQEESAHAKPGSYPLHVQTYQHSRDGQCMVAHRTVLREDLDGPIDPRLAFRTEMYRVNPSGHAAKL